VREFASAPTIKIFFPVYAMSVRPRSTVSPFVSNKRVRRMVSLPRRKNPIYKSVSMKAPMSHVLFRTCSINMTVGTTGFDPAVGLVSSNFFSMWFTNQSAFIWIDNANYSTVSVPGYSDLAALFDEVRIDAIEMQIIVVSDPTTTSNGSAVIGFATDYNDHNAPASVGDLQQYADYRAISMANRYIYKRLLTPKFLTYSLDSAGGAVASTPKRGFIRSNLDIDHNCLKACIISQPGANNTFCVSFKYKFTCKIQK